MILSNGSHPRNVTSRENLPRIDYMEVNRDGVIGKLPGESDRIIHFGKGIRELALLRIDVFRSEVVTALTTANSGSAGKGDGDKREEGSENNGKAKNHRRKANKD